MESSQMQYSDAVSPEKGEKAEGQSLHQAHRIDLDKNKTQLDTAFFSVS